MIRKLYISWRAGLGKRRYIIAKVQREANGVRFVYLPEFRKAQDDGLDYFFGFKDVNNLTSIEIENLLSLRVISKDRPDREDFLKFWEADGIEDIFDLLAFTQGKSPSDNFEFLADFLTIKEDNFKFVSDLAGLSHLKIPKGSITIGDSLNYVHENENEKDKEAIAVYKGDVKIGYIKKVHNRIFKLKRTLKLKVKAIDENGYLKQVFVLIEK